MSPARDRNGRPAWVRIVVVTYNSGAHTQNCLDALAAQTDPDFECVILDNQSVDGAIELLSLPDGRFTLVRNGSNDGFAGGSNLGLEGAETPYVMTLNPDTVLDPDCLAVLRQTAEAFDQPAMLTPLLWRGSSRRVLDGAGDSLSIFGYAWRNGYGAQARIDDLPPVVEVFGPSGAAALYRRDRFEAQGGFDADFFCYFEDVDLALRMRGAGGRCLLATGATGVHSGGHSTAAQPDFATYHTARNRLPSIVKSAPLTLLPLMLIAAGLSHAFLQWRNRGDARVNAPRARGFRDGNRRLGQAFVKRLRRRPYPLGASWRVARRLSFRRRDVAAQTFRHWPADP